MFLLRLNFHKIIPERGFFKLTHRTLYKMKQDPQKLYSWESLICPIKSLKMNSFSIKHHNYIVFIVNVYYLKLVKYQNCPRFISAARNPENIAIYSPKNSQNGRKILCSMFKAN